MDYPRLELIAAVDQQRGIGKDNKLPWKIPSEFAYFLRMTQSVGASGKMHAAVFGRRTWESIPLADRPWKNSICYIISRSMKQSDVQQYSDVYICADLGQVIRHLRQPFIKDRVDRIWVHGGKVAYLQAMQSAHFYRLYLTKIDAVFPADVFFPRLDESRMQLVHDAQVPHGVQQDNGVCYQVYVYQSLGLDPVIYLH